MCMHAVSDGCSSRGCPGSVHGCQEETQAQETDCWKSNAEAGLAVNLRVLREDRVLYACALLDVSIDRMADSYKASFRAAKAAAGAKPSKYQLQQLKAKRAGQAGQAEPAKTLPSGFFDAGEAAVSKQGNGEQSLPPGFFDSAGGGSLAGAGKATISSPAPPAKRARTEAEDRTAPASSSAEPSRDAERPAPSALAAASAALSGDWGSLSSRKGDKARGVREKPVASKGTSEATAPVDRASGTLAVQVAGSSAAPGLPKADGVAVREGGAGQGEQSGAIPVGFFDDKNKDREARGAPAEETPEAAMARFQREIEVAEVEAEEEVAKATEAEAVDREAVEDLERLQAVVRVNALKDALEDRREAAKRAAGRGKEEPGAVGEVGRSLPGGEGASGSLSEDEGSDAESDDLLGIDWRAKGNRA